MEMGRVAAEEVVVTATIIGSEIFFMKEMTGTRASSLMRSG